jgi:hypothetical protein
VNVINKVSLIEFLCWWLKVPASFSTRRFQRSAGQLTLNLEKERVEALLCTSEEQNVADGLWKKKKLQQKAELMTKILDYDIGRYSSRDRLMGHRRTVGRRQVIGISEEGAKELVTFCPGEVWASVPNSISCW